MTVHMGSALFTPEARVGKPARWRLALIGVLALVALGWSAYLATVSLGWVELGLCSSGSCAQLVLTSPWARWFGVPVSLLGMCVYIALLSVLPLASSPSPARRRIAWSALVGLSFVIAGAAFWFVGLMTLHLHKSCGHCASMHLLGAVIAYIVLTMAPMGGGPSGLLGARRLVGLSAIALGALLVLVGGQALPMAWAPPPSVKAAAAEPAKPAPEVEPGPADLTSANSPEGKASLVAYLKTTYGDAWDKPTTGCHMIRHFASLPRVRASGDALLYEVLHEGSGPTPRPQDTVRIHIKGQVWGGELIQDTFASGHPKDVRVNEMIPGLAQGLVLMPAGSRWRLLISPKQAYGAVGLPGLIPPDTMLLYEVELLEVLPDTTTQTHVTAAAAAPHQGAQQ